MRGPAPAPSFDSREAVERHQLARLVELIAAIIPDNRFYSEKLGRPHFDSLDEFVARVPFTTRAELDADQAAHPPFGTNLTYPLARYTRFSQTSGTTGRPMHWLDTPESWRWMVSNWLRVLEASGVVAGDRVFFAFSFGPFLGFWLGFEAAVAMGCLCVPGGGLRSEARLAAMLDCGVTVLGCTPTYAIHLAEVAAAAGIDLASTQVRMLIVAGEPGGSIPATRARIAQLWPGARIADHHGMTEVGPVTYECARRAGVLHVIEASYIAEVIEPATGRAVAPGERGELVLTNLGRLGSPLLRYRTGDVVERGAAERCACGTADLALPGGILSRTDDMVVVRGVNVYPGAIEAILRECQGVAEYRVEVATVDSLRELRIVVEPEPSVADPPALVHRVRTALNNSLGLRVEVSPAEPGALPRFELKARRWVRV
jgi:phenylacetate-CoA ligase